MRLSDRWPTARRWLAGGLIAATSAFIIGLAPAAHAATAGTGTAPSATSGTPQTNVGRSVAEQAHGIAYRYGVQRSAHRAQSAQGSTGTAPSTNPSCQGCLPPLQYGGGTMMGGSAGQPGHVTITPVYWAPSGFSHPFTASYKNIINQYLSDVAAASGTTGNVFGVDTQYYQQVGGVTQHIQYRVTAGPEVDVTDPFLAPDAGSQCPTSLPTGYTVCVGDAGIRAELAAKGLTADDAHLYMVFLPQTVETCTPEGGISPPVCSSDPMNGFCGYHSVSFQGAGMTNPLVYANMPYAVLATNPAPTCGDPVNGPQAPNGNAFADAEVSVVSHEANESITDWNGQGWIDPNLFEQADQCAYVFGNPLGGSAALANGQGTLYNQVINGHRYYTQEEFSNSDYRFGQGSVVTPGVVGQVAGCIQRPTLPTSFTLAGGAATDISVGANGAVWVIGTNNVVGGHGIYRRTGLTWAGIPGGGVDIAVDPHGNPWIVNSAHQIYSWNGSGWVHQPGSAYDIAIGGDGTPWIIGTSPAGGGNFGIYVWLGNSWVLFGGAATTIGGGPEGLPWVVNAAHQIYRLTVQGQGPSATLVWTGVPGGATNLGLGDLDAWVTGTNALGGGNFGIYHWTGTAWASIPGAGVAIAAGPDGNPWVINAAHSIYN